jgi:hypothetical protein
MMLKEVEFDKKCECGTGLKFGERCGKVLIQMAAEAAYREKFPGPRLISTKSDKYRIRAVWNKIHFRPLTEHLHEFIVKVLIQTLGKSWCKAQREKVPEEQHIIMRWIDARSEFFKQVESLNLKKINQEGKSVFGSVPPAFVGITNSGWFYEGKSPAGRGESLAFVLSDAAHPLKIPLTIEALNEALKLFSIIPDEDI